MRKQEVGKKGQVTIFIIVALVIVVLGVLIYLLYPRISGTFGGEFKNPNAFMKECLVEDLEEGVNLISLQGGSIRPDHYIMYDNQKVEYLCYTNEYYETCVVQQPMLETHVENELAEHISNSFNACLDDLKSSYENQGYDVGLQKKDFMVDLQLNEIVLMSNSSLRLTKDSSDTYDSIRITVNNNIYELVSIAHNIIDWEAQVGDAETTLYMDAYRNLKVEKDKLTDGTTVYVLTDRDKGTKFQFASRSVAWPPGFGGIE